MACPGLHSERRTWLRNKWSREIGNFLTEKNAESQDAYQVCGGSFSLEPEAYFLYVQR
jgi:hypothetical protein